MDVNQFIAAVAAEVVRPYVAKHGTLGESEGKSEHYRVVTTDLIKQALSNGLILPDVSPKFSRLGGGRTALAVSMATVPLNFVVKLDTSPQLIREARTIDELRNDIRLREFRDRLPCIYAQYSSPETETFAYVMEMFSSERYVTLSDALFGDPVSLPSEEEAVEKILAIADVLFPAYKKTVDRRLEVRMAGEAYYERLNNALLRLPEMHDAFRSVKLFVNGEQLPPWGEMLGSLKARSAELQRLAPPFITFVHGDPNPGNILLARGTSAFDDIRFIDLKDWKVGDYLFDVAKINHALLYTRPIEKLAGYSKYSADITDRTCVRISYEREKFPFAEAAAVALLQRAHKFATELSDTHAAQRYYLAMAVNLIGIVPRRFEEAPEVAQILYCEGLLLLNKFLQTM